MEQDSKFFEKTPFYMTYPMQNMYEAEMEYEKDIERIKQWHPSEVKRIQEMIDERCDELEFEGSRMFDEEPDHYMMQQEALDIYHRLQEEPESELQSASVKIQGKKMYFEGISDFQLEAASCDRGGRCDDWLSHMVEILFYNEMYRRRCRHRRCRRWW